MSHKLIASISLKTTEASLRSYFEKIGKISTVKVFLKNGRNFGEIEVEDVNEFLSNEVKVLDGKIIKIISVEKENKKIKEKKEEFKKKLNEQQIEHKLSKKTNNKLDQDLKNKKKPALKNSKLNPKLNPILKDHKISKKTKEPKDKI